MPTRTVDSLSKMSDKLLPHQDELQQLGELAGIHMDSKVFRILVELLNMGVDANTIFNLLKSIRRSAMKHSHTSITPRP